MPGERRAETLHLGGRQVALPPLPAIAPDPHAWVGPLGPVPQEFCLFHQDGKNRRRTIRGRRRRAEGGEPLLNVAPRDLRDLHAAEPRQDLVAVIDPVDLASAGLPVPFAAPEQFLHRCFEHGLVGPAGRVPAPPDRGEHVGGQGPSLADIHCRVVSDDLPDAFSAMLTVDEEAFSARGQHPDAETLKPAVAYVVDGVAGAERSDAGVGESRSEHGCSPGCGCSRGTESCTIRFPATRHRRKNDLLSNN